MICPACGNQAAQQGETFWCPNCRIALIQKLNTEIPQEPIPEERKQETGGAPKIVDILITLIIFILFIVIVAIFAWGYLHGGFSDSSPILPRELTPNQ